jgi:hypothetical protein
LRAGYLRVAEDVGLLRGFLFFEVRAHRHGGGYGEFSEFPFVAALVEPSVNCIGGGSGRRLES